MLSPLWISGGFGFAPPLQLPPHPTRESCTFARGPPLASLAHRLPASPPTEANTMQSAMTRALVAANPACNSRQLAGRPISGLKHKPLGRAVAARASKEFDLDTFLMDAANKFEKAENKPVIIGYSVAAASAILTAEWFIHLPVFNALLGFPIQLLGLLMLPYLGIKYLVDGADPIQDVETVLNKVTNELPGLGKK